MLITEVLKSSANWDVKIETEDEFKATFLIGSTPYTFYAYTDNGEDEWDVWFSLGENSRGRFDITNSGSSLLVFGTVIDIFRAFMRKYNPDIIHFTAAEPSRMKLYVRLINTLLPKWYKYIDEDNIYISHHPIE